MIRIVKIIMAKIAGTNSQFQKLPMVPASGTLRTDVEDSESGIQVKRTLTARLNSSASALHDILYSDLILAVEFEDGTSVHVGTKDLPVRLRFSESDSLDISAEHVEGAK